MRWLAGIVLLSGCAGSHAVRAVQPMGPVTACPVELPCDEDHLAACETLGDRAADTSEAAEWYRQACGHFEGRDHRGTACRKLAEIYWDNREADPHYRARALEYWDQGCHGMSPDEASCRPAEVVQPAIGTALAVPPALPAASFREAFLLGRERFDLGDFGGAIAAFRRALELTSSGSDGAAVHARPALHFYIGQAYRMAGDPVHALPPLEQFLHDWPDAPNHRLAAELVRQLRAQIGPPPLRQPRPAPTRPLP